MNDDMPQMPQYGMPEGKDERTFKEVWADRSRMSIWYHLACCCGCILFLPVPMAIFGLLFV